VSLLLCHDNVTPFYVITILLLFMSWQYYSLVGRFFSVGVPACNSPLDKSASDYSSSLVLLEVSPANYSFRIPIVGQNHLFLFWSPAASLFCHHSVDQVGGRGLLHECWLLRRLKGPLCQRDRKRGSEIVLSWRLSDRYQGWCVDGCADRGRRAVRKNGWLNGGRWCDVMWVSPQIHSSV